MLNFVNHFGFAIYSSGIWIQRYLKLKCSPKVWSFETKSKSSYKIAFELDVFFVVFF